MSHAENKTHGAKLQNFLKIYYKYMTYAAKSPTNNKEFPWGCEFC